MPDTIAIFPTDFGTSSIDEKLGSFLSDYFARGLGKPGAKLLDSKVYDIQIVGFLKPMGMSQDDAISSQLRLMLNLSDIEARLLARGVPMLRIQRAGMSNLGLVDGVILLSIVEAKAQLLPVYTPPVLPILPGTGQPVTPTGKFKYELDRSLTETTATVSYVRDGKRTFLPEGSLIFSGNREGSVNEISGKLKVLKLKLVEEKKGSEVSGLRFELSPTAVYDMEKDKLKGKLQAGIVAEFSIFGLPSRVELSGSYDTTGKPGGQALFTLEFP